MQPILKVPYNTTHVQFPSVGHIFLVHMRQINAQVSFINPTFTGFMKIRSFDLVTSTQTYSELLMIITNHVCKC